MKELASQSLALSLGVSALVTVVCRKIKIPALLPLLAVGLALGASGLGVVDGSSLGHALKGFITVAIGLLIFEGALHLNREDLGRAPMAVWGFLTIGALITWVGSAIAAWKLLNMSPQISALLGACVIVTGPTVVQPLLRLMNLSPRLHVVLSAEAVLIDPIGVVAAVATLEVVRLHSLLGPGVNLAGEGAWIFAKPLLGGAGVGIITGLAGRWLLTVISNAGKPDSQLLNLFAVGVCMTSVGVGEAFTPEAGLAAVTICGIIMARDRVLGGTVLREFKELLAIILVGTLFVMLASRFDVAQLRTLGWPEVIFVALLIFAIRPIGVLLSTWGSKLTRRERAFAATFAPRGIVALSVATVAAAELHEIASGDGLDAASLSATSWMSDIDRLDRIVFIVIVGTVFLGSTLSPLVAWLLNVHAGRGNAVLLIGAHQLSIAFARALGAVGIDVRLVDSNLIRVAEANDQKLSAVEGDATDMRWLDDVAAPRNTGWVLAWTGNHDVDQIAARWGQERLSEGHSAVWSSKPARGKLERWDISGGIELGADLDRIERNEVIITNSELPENLEKILAWVENASVSLATPGRKIPEKKPGVLFVGLQKTANSNH